LEQGAIRKPAQNTWPICTQVVKSPILRHFSFGGTVFNKLKSEIRFSYDRALHVRVDQNLYVNIYNFYLIALLFLRQNLFQYQVPRIFFLKIEVFHTR